MTSDNKTFMIHLATSLSDHSTLSVGEAEQFVGKFFDVVRASLLTDKIVKVRGLGTFKLVDVEPRESVKVVTGERYVIAGHSKVTFTPDPVLRDAVNRPFADFQTVELNDGVDLAIMEAVDELEHYIDDALLLQIHEVRIIHGKGDGILRKVVREFLAKNSDVKHFRDEAMERGGYGATVVEM